jgi:pimeloyl-ACP methyl ester carboxylesterase
MDIPERTLDIDTGDVTLSCLVAGEGPVVIALHGFPDHRGAFRPLLPALVGAGYKVIMPALRGYRPSGVARSGRHDARSAGADAIALADHFSPGVPARIVGHDWGAVAAFAATASAPHRFSHLVSMAVPHLAVTMPRLFRPAQLRRSWYMGLFQLRGVAERRLERDNFAFVERLWRDWSPGYVATEEEIHAVKEGIRGRVGPVLAYYRALLSPRTMLEARDVFAPTQVPAIHLHGEDDGCIGVEIAEGAERHYRRGYILYRIPGAGHFLIQEKPAAVGEILVEFLKS